MFRPYVVVSLLALASVASAQRLPSAEPSLERLSSFPLIHGRSPVGASMAPDGSRIVFGWNRTGARRLDVYVLDYPNGEPRLILDTDKIPRPIRQDDTRTDEEKKDEIQYDGGIGGFQWSPDSKEILTSSYRGRVWRMDPDGKNLRPLIDTNEPIGSPTYSPDGKYIGFLRNSNVFRLDRSNGQIRQLTFISKPNTTVDSFQWSPDSKNLAVTWSDSSKLGSHVMMDFTKDRATVVNIRRMWHGEMSVNTQMGIVPAEGGLIKFVEDLPRYMWRTDLAWSPDSSMIATYWIKEDFQEATITVLPISTMKKADVYTEKAPKNYIPDFRRLLWTRDSKRILFTTDIIDGKFTFRSLRSMTPAGREIQDVYREQHDISAVGRAEESDRIVLVTLARTPLTTEITILEPDGKRTSHVVSPTGNSTPNQFDASALPLMSDDGRRIATLAGRHGLNPELYAVEPRAARLTTSQTPEFAKIQWAEETPVTFPGPDGRTIHGVLLTKPGMDKSKKYPAFVSNMYANSAKRSWGGYLDNYAVMNLDMVVLQVDFRASWGYGGEFNSGYFKSMGIIDADEAVSAKKFLDTLGYVRSDRVGLWGWSYGGFLTCMVMLTRPDVFDTGVAVASVTDWKSYNEWYTRRRLGMEKDDKDAYVKTSPISFPGGLKGNLLLVHGMLDDNVLFQDIARLAQRMIGQGKYFDMAFYPRDDHSIGRDDSRPHVQVTILHYLWQKLSRP